MVIAGVPERGIMANLGHSLLDLIRLLSHVI
jgi:hypothetical protein